MNKHFFSSPILLALTKWSTWLFVLASILLHIFLLESSAWKDGIQKPLTNETPSITVSLKPVTLEREADITKPDTPKPTPPKSRPSVTSSVQTITPDTAAITNNPSETITKQQENPPELISTVVNETDTPPADTTPSTSTSAAPEFQLRMPESAEMQLEITNTKVNGSPMTGVGRIVWESYNGKYKISIEAGLNLLVTTLNLLTITSEGMIDVYGLMPTMSNDIRRTRAATAIHFNHENKSISFSASNKVIPMETGAQDAASVLLQLAAIGYADPNQLATGREFSIQVAEGKDATPFLFRVVGEEEIVSPLSGENTPLPTVHITRPPKPGFYNSQLDIWLAPSLGWYPVQIRNTESSGTVTNQRVIALKQKVNLEK